MSRVLHDSTEQSRRLSELQKTLPYQFKEPNYLKCSVGLLEEPVSFSHLEVIGDSLLNMVVKTTLARNNPSWDASKITVNSQKYCRNLPAGDDESSILMKIAEDVGLKAYFQNRSMYKGRWGYAHTQASSVEALIGAVFYDTQHDLEAVRVFIMMLFRPHGLELISSDEADSLSNESAVTAAT